MAKLDFLPHLRWKMRAGSAAPLLRRKLLLRQRLVLLLRTRWQHRLRVHGARSRINQAKAPAWPIGVDHHMVANSRAQELNTAFQQTWIAVKSTNKRMRVIDNDFDAKTTRPNAIPNMVANALDTIDDTAAAVFGPIVP
eukprot:GEMP01061551.1.p1 GENE.GEMP01061551.1~~GEMP01061551.1.p1  ORF type:complete len:139 (+),score=35.32 GEMP01061551.1:204-620(+)